MMKRVLLAFLALCIGAALPASAQTTAEGSLRGHVKDEQGGALAGVTLTATSPTVPVSFTATTDAAGYYRLLNLPPGEYQVAAELTGFAKHLREGIVIRAGLNLGLELTLKVGALAETVEVKLADTPMIEAQSAVQGFNVSGDFQRTLPISFGRHWSNSLAITPGLTGNQLTTRTADSFTLRGGDFASHVIQIDGADMASAQQGATLYVNLSSEAIEDVHVKTGAVDASAPLGVGAVINVATKSGTNQFRGAVSATLQRQEWSGNNNPGGTRAAVGAFIPEAALGGPVLRDRAWFFGSYRHERVSNGISRAAQQVATLRALNPEFEPYDAKLSGHFAMAKLSARVSGWHQAELSYAYDPQKQEAGTPTEAGQFLDNIFGGNRNVGARVSSVWGSRLATRFGASYNNKAQKAEIDLGVTSRPVHGTVAPVGGRLVGSGVVAVLDNAASSLDQLYDKYTLSGDLTYFHAGGIGSHEIQAGLYLQPRIREEVSRVYPNHGFSREESVLRDSRDPSRGVIPFWREIWDVDSLPVSRARARDFAFYLQDAWKPTDRLTLNLGVRLDLVRRVDDLFDVTLQDSKEVGPRFGLNYALTSNRKTILRASWVRVHDVLSATRANSGTNNAGKRDLYDTNLDGVFETELVTPPSTARATDRILDPERGQPYVNESAVGLRRQFAGRLTADVSFVRREYRHRTAWVEQNGIYEDGVFRGYRDERFNDVFKVTNNAWNWPVYSGLELQVVKDAARLRFVGSYTRAWRHMAGTWQPNDPASFIQPDAFPNDKGNGGVFVSTGSSADANSLSGTHSSFNATWFDHAGRGGIVFHGPWDLVLASSYSVQTGRFSGPIVTRIAAPDPRFGPATVTLSNGRRVSNPLATTIRFANPTRGDGQLELSMTHVWNLRVGRDFRLSGERRLELAVDVFNLPNAGADQSYQDGAHQLYSPNYGRATLRQSPRSLRLSGRLAF